jgi:L-fuculose-phosphate aldolase
MKGYAFRPIGFVKSDIRIPQSPDNFRNVVAEIVVDECYEDALDGIVEGQWIVVLFIFHKSNGFSLKVHPRGDTRRALRGLFSTCSPARPNPVGATPVEILKVDGRRLAVKGLDAIDGSPVIDIKPFVWKSDSSRERGR